MFFIKSQGDIAYEKIKNMIFHLEIKPGEKISELQLSNQLNLSRTPVHDALRKLQSEGLTRIERNKGAEVTSYTDEEVKEIGEIRLAQDMLSAELAIYYGSNSDFDRLDSLAQECVKAASRGDIYERIQTDSNFHLEITRISKNAMLYEQQYRLYQQIHLVQISKYTDIEDSLAQIHHHGPMIQALRDGNLAVMKGLICDHIRDFFQVDSYLIDCYKG